MKKALMSIITMLLFAGNAYAATINLNTATKEELDTLQGIGPSKADAIIKYRNDKGSFKSTDELKEVYGIGVKIYDRIKDDVVIELPHVEEEKPVELNK